MIKVGLTGNIGSGKSTVARIFEIMGVPVFHADVVGRDLLFRKDVIDGIVKLFGQEVVHQEQIDRKKLAAIVFKDKSALESLNSLIHPLVREELDEWIEEHMSFPYIVQEAAILFESGFYKNFEKVILVSCPQELAVNRVMNRDTVAKSDVLARLANQWPEEKKIPLADYVINNDGSELVIPQVLEIHRELVNR